MTSVQKWRFFTTSGPNSPKLAAACDKCKTASAAPAGVGDPLRIEISAQGVQLLRPILLLGGRSAGNRPQSVLSPAGNEIQHSQPSMLGDGIFARRIRLLLESLDGLGQALVPVARRRGLFVSDLFDFARRGGRRGL